MPSDPRTIVRYVKYSGDFCYDSPEHHHECDFLVHNADGEPWCFLYGYAYNDPDALERHRCGYTMRCKACKQEYL